MRRRDCLVRLGGALVAWPLAARAQPLEHKRIAILTGLPRDDPEGEARFSAFLQGMARLGWTVGRDLEIEHRAAGRDPERYREYAQELVALRPDLFLAGGTPAVVSLQAALQRVARGAVPVVFANATDPAGFGVELMALGDHDLGEIERGIAAFVHGPTDGLIVTAQLAQAERAHVIALAARYRLPAVYPFRRYVSEGGLISYGSDQIEPFRSAAGYVDRILTGERPIALPVQGPARYETAVNLKTARALGLNVPATVLVRADEVIE